MWILSLKAERKGNVIRMIIERDSICALLTVVTIPLILLHKMCTHTLGCVLTINVITPASSLPHLCDQK